MKKGIEWQVANRELSEQLKKLGVEQKSRFSWGYYDGAASELSVISESDYFERQNGIFKYSAFTVAELGEMLPRHVVLEDKEFYFTTLKGRTEWEVQYEIVVPLESHHYEEATTEADARAKMLIYLIENGLVKTELLTSKKV